MYLSIVVVYFACIDSVSLFSAVQPWAVGGYKGVVVVFMADLSSNKQT
jgi:hypothetical protein